MRKITFTLITLFLSSLLLRQGAFAQITPQTFNCSGAPQNYTVPPCVTTVTVEAWGAGGGGGGIDDFTGSPGGGGAYATSVLTVTPGQVLTVYVGCGGLQGGACQGNGPGGAGGFGYGTGGNGGNSGPSGCSGPGGGGGGGSAVLNGATPLVVAGGGGGGGGGGQHGGGADGGGGGQSGSAQSSAGGILGASGSTNGLNGASTAADGAGGGGGGGGVNGGGGGQVPGTDYGGSGGAGGTSLGSTVIIASGQTPGNAGSPNLCAGCAVGGNGGSGAPGIPGDVVISYVTPVTITGTITNGAGACGIATATVVPSGGTPGYTYAWSPIGGNAAVSTNLTNGSYTVTITDANGCSGTATTTIALPPALIINVVTTSVTCNGLSNGSATATVSGGTGPTYTVGINSTPMQAGITTGTFAASGLPAASYTFGVQDGAGCQTFFPITIAQPAVLQQTLTATSPICVGSSSVLTDAVSGGTAPYTVTWSSGGNFVGALGTTTVSPITTTTYSASVLDANNCPNTAVTTVTVNPLPIVAVNSATICAGSSTTLTANGANTYAWALGGGLSGTTGTSVTANPVTTTIYTITGTDINNCVNTATSTVTVNPLPSVTATSATICIGNSSLLTANGANTYAWSPGTGLSAITGNSVTANPIITTVYTIIGTDVNNCVNVATSTVTVNPLPVITVNSGAICMGSSISLTANGANTYAWSPGTGLSAITGNNVTANPVITTVYTITGTDVNTCTNTITSTVTVNPLPVVTVNSPSICVGGSITLTAGGANTYAWSPAGGLSATTGTSVTANPAITSVYTITGTDLNNCVSTATSTVTVNAPPVVVVNSATICAGFSTTLTATGATTYTWSPGTGLSATTGSLVTANPLTTTPYTITGSNGCIFITTATVTVNPLPIVTVNSATICPTFSATLNAAGAATYSWNTGAITPSVTISPNSTTPYTVTGTDANNCSSSATATITVNPALVLNIGGTTPICQGATLNLTTSPGVAWIWQGPLAFSSFSQNPSIANAQPNMSGTYSVAAQDINGCADTAFINITVNPLPLPVASNNSPICANQALNFSGSGSGGGSYVWTGPNSYSVSTQNPSMANASVNVSGTYTLTVIDLNNCKNTDTTLVIVNPNPVVTVNSATICAGSSAVLTANGATGTYTWTPSTGLSANIGSPVTANPATTSSYSVTGINVTGCSATVGCSVVVNQLPLVAVNSGTICVGKNTTLQALNANTFTWTPANGLSSSNGSTVIASPASSATYIVSGTDVNNCVNTATCTVLVNPLPNIIVSPLVTSGCEPLCVDFSNVGATSNGIYAWNFGDGNTNTIPAPSHCFSQGTFSVSLQLKDTNGCVNTSIANVIAFPKPVANFYATPQPTTILDPLIHFVDGTSGGSTIATWNWNFGDNHGISATQNPSYAYSDTGTFAVQLVVVSDLGCRDSVIIKVTIDDEYLIYVPNAFTPNFDGTNDVFMPKAEGVTEYKLYVFDRWGDLMFYSTDLYSGWDGRKQSKGTEIVQEDTYVWKIEAKNKRGEPRLLKGVVSLLK